MLADKSLGPGGGIVLKSHVHFLGRWRSAFDIDQTKPGPFFLLGGKHVRVPFMHADSNFKCIQNPDGLFAIGSARVTLIELPFGEGSASMVVLLPYFRNGLYGLVRSLSSKNLSGWLKKLDDTEKIEVVLSLPRFELKSDLELQDPLTPMGLGLAAKPKDADFSRLSPIPAYISAVTQDAQIRVDETGAEASAETEVQILPALGGDGHFQPPPPLVVTIDHPFVYFIKDNATGAPLFMGQVCDPSR